MTERLMTVLSVLEVTDAGATLLAMDDDLGAWWSVEADVECGRLVAEVLDAGGEVRLRPPASACSLLLGGVLLDDEPD